MDQTNEGSIDHISIYDAEREWKEHQEDEQEHLYRRYVVGRAFQLDDDEPRIRETHTGQARPPTLRRFSREDRQAQARYFSMSQPRSAGENITRLSTVETIDHSSPEVSHPSNDIIQKTEGTEIITTTTSQDATEASSGDINRVLKQSPTQATLPAWATARFEDISWSDEENEDLGIYATAGSKQRLYDLQQLSESEEEGEAVPESDQQGVAPAVDVSEAATPPAPSQTNMSTNFTLDSDDIECQLLEDPAGFKTYIQDLNTKLQLIITSTSSAEQTMKELLEEAEDAYHKRLQQQAAVERELREKLAKNEADLETFKEELHEHYKSKFDTEVAARDTRITRLDSIIAEQRVVIEHNSNSTTNFYYKEKAKAVQAAKEELHEKYNEELRSINLEWETNWKNLRDNRNIIVAQLKASNEKLSKARDYIEDCESSYIELRSAKDNLELQFAAERQNLTHPELVNEQLESTRESELAAIRREQEEQMKGTRAAKEKEIATIRAEMKDLKDEIEFKDEQLVQLADLTISEVELKEKVRDLQAQIVEKDLQSAMGASLELEKNIAVTERDEARARVTTLEAQLAVQATRINDNNQLEACEIEKRALQAEIIELRTRIATVDDELLLSFTQAEELAALRIEHKKLHDELKQAKETPSTFTTLPRSECMQNAMDVVAKMRKALDNRPAPYVCKYKIKTEEERKAEHARLVALSV